MWVARDLKVTPIVERDLIIVRSFATTQPEQRNSCAKIIVTDAPAATMALKTHHPLFARPSVSRGRLSKRLGRIRRVQRIICARLSTQRWINNIH